MTRPRSSTGHSSSTVVIGGAVAAAALGVIVLLVTRDDDEAASAGVVADAGDPTPVARAPAKPTPPVAEDKVVFSIPVAGDPVRGEPDALVTVVRASEYMCPFCERSREAFERVLADYPRDVRIVHKDLAHIHAEGPRLAAAACAAHKQNQFWEMDDLLWEAYRQRRVSPDDVEALAERLGLEMTMYREDTDGVCPREIEADERIFEDLGIRGVPAYFINGRLLRGAQPYHRFKTLVDEELALARRRVASGANRATYYQDWVVATGLTTYGRPPLAEAPDPNAP